MTRSSVSSSLQDVRVTEFGVLWTLATVLAICAAGAATGVLLAADLYQTSFGTTV